VSSPGKSLPGTPESMTALKGSSPSWAAANGLDDFEGEGAAVGLSPDLESKEPLIFGSMNFMPGRLCCPLQTGSPGGSCLVHVEPLSSMSGTSEGEGVTSFKCESDSPASNVDAIPTGVYTCRNLVFIPSPSSLEKTTDV